MIPGRYINEWRQQAPWPDTSQVEQDLLLSRALVEMFQEPEVSNILAFRGGTALHKLFLKTAGRYSEDLDLVKVVDGSIEGAFRAVRKRLDPWLGIPQRTKNTVAAALGVSPEREIVVYEPSSTAGSVVRLKIEINVQERFSVLGTQERTIDVASGWFSGSAQVKTFALEELLGTKLRALFQRKRGRDLFDLWHASRQASVDPGQLIECFTRYMAVRGQRVTRAAFEKNLASKLRDPAFAGDVTPLLAPGVTWDPLEAGRWVREELVSRLPERGPSLMGSLVRRLPGGGGSDRSR